MSFKDLEAAKHRVAEAEKRAARAARALRSAESRAAASKRELRDAEEYLRNVAAANEPRATDSDSHSRSDCSIGHGDGRACDLVKEGVCDEDTDNEGGVRKRRAEEEGGGEPKRRVAEHNAGEWDDCVRLVSNPNDDTWNGHIHVRVKLYFKEIIIDLKPSETIRSVKDRIRVRAGIIARRRLIHTRSDVYICKRLEDDNLTVSDYEINSDSTLHMV